MRKRNRHVSVWMNEAEYLHLKAEAKKAGLGIDPFIRLLESGVQLRPRPPMTKSSPYGSAWTTAWAMCSMKKRTVSTMP